MLNNYRENGKEVSEKTLLFAEKALQNGEIDFSKYLQLLEDATRIEIDYLTALFNYNKTVLEINYLLK